MSRKIKRMVKRGESCGQAKWKGALEHRHILYRFTGDLFQELLIRSTHDLQNLLQLINVYQRLRTLLT